MNQFLQINNLINNPHNKITRKAKEQAETERKHAEEEARSEQKQEEAERRGAEERKRAELKE